MALQPTLWPSFWRCLGAIDSERQAHTPDHFKVNRFTFDTFKKIMFETIPQPHLEETGQRIPTDFGIWPLGGAEEVFPGKD